MPPIVTVNRVALPVFAVIFLALAVAWPTYRLYRRTGKLPLAGRERESGVQRYVREALSAICVGFILVAQLYGIVGPDRLGIWSASLGVTLAGWGLACAGFLLVVVAQHQMGASWRIGISPDHTELVAHGLYRVVRNPIFAGMLALMLGLTLIMPCPWTVMGFVLAAVLLGLQARLEEEHLTAIHGEAYRRYTARVGRFVPLIGRIRERC